MPRSHPFRTNAAPARRLPEDPTLSGRNVDDASFLLSSRRTRLSFQRTRMSSDRTLMSIIRTALSMIGFGFTIYQFFRYLQESSAVTILGGHVARNFGVALVALGVVLLVLGIVGHIQFMLELRREHDLLVRDDYIPSDFFPFSVTLLTALLLLCVGILAIFSMVVRVGPFT
jgi:putative membrane protein